MAWHTLSSPGIFFLQVSPYPLILSLENHCSVEQQAVMATHLCTILGSKLLTKPLSSQPLQDLPSPEVRRSRLGPFIQASCPSAFLTESFVAMTFVAGAEGAHPDKREKADSSPGPAGEGRQLCQLLLQL